MNTSTAKTVKPCLARLYVSLDSTQYALRIMPAAFDVDAVRVVRLGKSDGTRYHVRQPKAGGLACDCPSAVFRPAEPCRYVRAMLACGLVENIPPAASALELKPKPLTEARMSQPTECPTFSDNGREILLPGRGWYLVSTLTRIIDDPFEPGAVLAEYQHSGRLRFRGDEANLMIAGLAEYQRRQQQGR